MNDSVFNIVSSNKCNAKCPYCISKQTPDVCHDFSTFNYAKLQKAVQYAVRAGIQTCKITGKNGDPLCNPAILDHILAEVRNEFPIVEIQTNGTLLSESTITNLAEAGVDIVAVSCVDYEQVVNEDIYGVEYPELRDLVLMLHSKGLSVRLSCTLMKNCIDTAAGIDAFLDYFNGYNVEQFSFIPVGWYGNSKEAQWSKNHEVGANVWERMSYGIATLLWRTSFGGAIYDYKGKNVYIADCLSSPVEEIRSLIYYPDGHLRYSWTKPGAIIF